MVMNEDVQGGNETILLVDDDQIILDLTGALLSGKGYKVLIARDGVEALDTYRMSQKEIALVLSDVGMPNLDGYSLLIKLKEMNPSIRVIIWSGFFDKSLTSDLLKAGAMGYIEKPCSSTLLLKVLRESLDSAGA